MQNDFSLFQLGEPRRAAIALAAGLGAAGGTVLL